MAETALVVVVPEAEAAIGDLRRGHTQDGAEGMPAHVTLLYPFADAEEVPEDEVAALAALWRPFRFALRRTARFPEVLWLAPEPDRPFVWMARALFAAFPQYPPYGGIHDTVIPHCTVAHTDPALLDGLAAEVEPLLPLESEAKAVTLVERGPDGRWRERRSLPFGG